MPARVYGNYVLVRKLAEGGMAEIFLAKQVGVEKFEKNVVIKRMLPQLSQAEDFVAMFLDEARLAASLTHPNIAQITDLGLAEGCYYICMEYLAGEDFATVLRLARRRAEVAPLSITLRVISHAAIGLHFAHEATDAKGVRLNLVHRDVSPSNIFVTYSGQVKVLDFGIAKAESRVTNTETGVIKGKYQYMSPEQARGEPVDRRSDVFSLGVSLYEALSGIRPFARNSDLAVLKALLDGEVKPLRELRPDIPPQLETIVAKAMARTPDDRYPTALAFVQDIERHLGTSTSVEGTDVLAQYLQTAVGEARVRSRVRIETLDEMAARGVDVPELPTIAGSPRRPSGEMPTMGRAPTLPMGRRTQRDLQFEKRRSTVVVVVGALLVGALGTLALLLWMPARNSPIGDSRRFSPNDVVALDAGVMAFAPQDAGPSAGLDAGVSEAFVDAGVKQVRMAPVKLTPMLVNRKIVSNQERFQSCLKEHRAALPNAQGTLRVDVRIASSGKVSSAEMTPKLSKLSGCVEGVARSIVFPRHADGEILVPFVLNYDVQRLK
jgi:serine/threonine-protein kinase